MDSATTLTPAAAAAREAAQPRYLPTYCYNCVSGPDLLTVKVEGGVATEVAPNFKGRGLYPGNGKPCVKAYGLIQKTYHPDRILTPMKRTNPSKGMDQDPGFVPISWDEALDIVAAKLTDIRARGVLDDEKLPRVALTLGHGGTPANYMGTFPAFIAAWGAMDYSFGSGQGVKCVHSEHLYGEYWHRAFTVSADTPNCNYNVSFGANVEVTGGVCAVSRHADARVRGAKRVQIEPHLSVTAAASAEWIPIKPKTDPAFIVRHDPRAAARGPAREARPAVPARRHLVAVPRGAAGLLPAPPRDTGAAGVGCPQRPCDAARRAGHRTRARG